MPDIRAPDIKDLAKEDYMKGMKYKDIATKYEVSLNTVKSWKTRYKWNRKSVHTNSKECAHKRGAPKGNKNAVGNDGGAPEGNLNALKHGAYSNVYLSDMSEEDREIFESLPSTLDLDQEIKTVLFKAYKISSRKDLDEEVKNTGIFACIDFSRRLKESKAKIESELIKRQIDMEKLEIYKDKTERELKIKEEKTKQEVYGNDKNIVVNFPIPRPSNQ